MNLIESVTNNKIGKLIAEAVSGTTSQKCTDFLQRYKRNWEKSWSKLSEFIAANPNEDYSDVRYVPSTDGKYYSVLMRLVAENEPWCDEQAIALIDAGADVNAPAFLDETIFQHAMTNDLLMFLRPELVEKLIEAGGDVDVLDWDHTWLWAMSNSRCSYKLFEILFENRPVNFNSPEMEHAVKNAFWYGNAAAIKFMRDHGYK